MTVPTVLLCGKTDLLSSPANYLWVRDRLQRANSQVFFYEYDLGHLGLIMPKKRKVMKDVLAEIKKFSHEGD